MVWLGAGREAILSIMSCYYCYSRESYILYESDFYTPQKSRVAFAALAYKKPHVLIIDEGSNHLSMEAVDALVEAVQDFKGGLMVVSHDQYFVQKTCSELWVIEKGSATRFRGDFEEYKAHTAEATHKRVEESVKKMHARQS